MSRFIDNYKVLLLDVGQTFMFNVDRFGLDDGIADTYKKFGGKQFSPQIAESLMIEVFKQMSADSKKPENFDNFKSVRDYLLKHPLISEKCPGCELALLEKVIAEHEKGVIPEKYVEVLKKFHKTHRLGIISDIWSKSEFFHAEFEKAGIAGLFDPVIFSSDLKAVKPGSKIFNYAVMNTGVGKSDIVYIGDSFRRDVVGAKKVGIAAILIGSENEECSEYKPDFVVSDLSELL